MDMPGIYSISESRCLAPCLKLEILSQWQTMSSVPVNSAICHRPPRPPALAPAGSTSGTGGTSRGNSTCWIGSSGSSIRSNCHIITLQPFRAPQSVPTSRVLFAISSRLQSGTEHARQRHPLHCQLPPNGHATHLTCHSG